MKYPITLKTRHLKAGDWKATIRHKGPDGEFHEVTRWGPTEDIAAARARKDLLDMLRLFDRYTDVVAAEEARVAA
jgi:hypothetical protein